MKKIFVIVITAFLFAINAGNLEYTYAAQHSVNFSLPLKFKWGHGGLVRGQKYKIKLRKAKQSASDLQQELAKENTIINIKSLEDAEVIEEVTKSTTQNDEGKILSKEEKIIRYFYLLDKDDQVAVLRQISKKIKKDKVILSTSKLELFEEKDLQEKELPVRKTLIRK